MVAGSLLVVLLAVPAVPGRREEDRRHWETAQEYEYEYDYQQQEYDTGSSSSGQYPIQGDNTETILKRNRLLIIVIDGFRWDYLDIYRRRTGLELEGFKAFMDQGVRSEYLESVFPAESFPAWQTIQTGLYPESHGIVGNQFYDKEVHEMLVKSGGGHYAFFNIEDERTTEQMKWWQKDEVEPIWATAARNGVSFATYLWGRCDIAYEDIKRFAPKHCENYYSKDLTKTLRINLDFALNQFQRGTDAAIIYEEALAKSGEEFGPESNMTMRRLQKLDQTMKDLEDRLTETSMKDFVNVIVLSDHGMTPGNRPTVSSTFDPELDNPISTVQLSKHLKSKTYKWIVGSGSHAGVYPSHRKHREAVVEALQGVPGLRAFARADIPEEFHYKKSPNSPPILVLADPGTVILASSPEVQRPRLHFPEHGRQTSNSRHAEAQRQRLLDQTKLGLSGYDPEEEDMRGIFMARGPDFKNTGEVVGPMKLVDVYQVLAYVLNFPANPHNGTWSRVRELLEGEPGAGAAWRPAAGLIVLLCGVLLL